MKKEKLICCLTALVVVFMIACKISVDENPITDDLNGGCGGLDPEVPYIIRTDPVVNWPTGLSAVVGQKLLNVKLPRNGTSMPLGTFTWTMPADPVGSTGTQTHNMTFTPVDTFNYNTLKRDIAVTVVPVKMVYIPAGTFIMGSNDPQLYYTSPEHQITLNGFYMSEYLVTQELYEAVTGYNPSLFNGDSDREPADGEDQGKRPVEFITWNDAVEFCNKLSEIENLQTVYTISDRSPSSGYPIYGATVIADFSKNGYRLPTEAQWEYACRAGATTAYSTGDTISGDFAWYYINSEYKTHQVGLKHPNAWGLYDMHGNVNEWCWDIFGLYPNTPSTGSSTWDNHIIRGGCYRYSMEDLHSARRNFYISVYQSEKLGFRLVRP